MDRWRKPLKISAIEVDVDGVMTIADKNYQNVDVTLEDDEDFDRIIQGYVCAQCFEPHEEAYPERCIVCGFEMRARQAQRLGVAFKGEKWIGPRESTEDELERLSKIVLPRRAH